MPVQDSTSADFRKRAVAEVLTPFLARHGFKLLYDGPHELVPSGYVAIYRNGDVAIQLYTEVRDGILVSFANARDTVESDGAVHWPRDRSVDYGAILRQAGAKDRTCFNWLQRFMIAESANEKNFRIRLAEICENLDRSVPSLLAGDPTLLTPPTA